MNAVGGEEIFMPMLHPKNIWATTGGWDKIDVLFKLKSRTEKEYALGQSEEEVVTPLVMKYVNTYQDLAERGVSDQLEVSRRAAFEVRACCAAWSF